MTIVVSKDKEWNVQTIDTTFCEVSIWQILPLRDGDLELMKSRTPDKTDTELCCKLNF